MPTDPVAPRRRRPKDRKDQILRAARELIVDAGYSNVTTTMIADRVGITAGALYRHFTNKSVLLGAVVEQALIEVTPTFGSTITLEDALAESCAHAVAHPDVGALWWREARYLPTERRDELRDLLRRANRQFAAVIARSRPDLPTNQIDELTWGVQAVLASPSAHTTRVGDAEFAQLLTAAALRICAADLPAPSRRRRPRSRLEPVSKREALLSHAVILFDQNGYDNTGLDEIGTAAGFSGPSTYNYFNSKADLLQAAIERGTSALWLLLHDVLRENSEPADALAALVRGYVDLALRKTILTSLLQTSQDLLEPDARDRQREYIAEWTALLRACRPELDVTRARILVHTALAVVHTLARVDHLATNGSLADDVSALSSAVLFLP